MLLELGWRNDSHPNRPIRLSSLHYFQLQWTISWYKPRLLLHSWAFGLHFSFLSWPICTYTITWPLLTWLLTCTTEPSCRELHCSLLLYIPYCSPFMVVCDHHCSWLHCSVMPIVCDPIVLHICMLSQVAALLYISWTCVLELGLKPDLVCNLLCSKSLLLDKLFPSSISLELSSNPWRYFPFHFIFTQTLVLATLLLLLPSKALWVTKGITTLVTSSLPHISPLHISHLKVQ